MIAGNNPRVARRRPSTVRTPAVKAPAATAGVSPLPRRGLVAIAAAIALLTVAVYAQVGAHGFIDLDDPGYVIDNPHVTGGLTLENIAWAFTTGHAANWHPLTWLSHMLDVTLFGVNPGAHHLVSVALHTANALLLFFVLVFLTRGRTGPAVHVGCAAFVAAVFAVHPVHVESVAWISERKDVLSTLFWLLTMWAYAAYLRSRSTAAALCTIGGFVLGLMSKPMLVTLPFVLILLHLWPLGEERVATLPAALRTGRIPRLVWALIALSALSSMVTFVVQRQGGAVSTLDVMPLSLRIGNALVSYVAYLGKTFWPANLAVFYPFRIDLAPAAAAAAALALATITVLIARLGRAHPYLLVGWGWYLGTLVPVIGLVQVGTQAMADRYLYVPLIGIAIAAAWGTAALAPRAHRTLTWVAAAIVVVLAVVAHRQVAHWQSSLTIWQRTVDVTNDNYRARNSLGAVLGNLGRTAEAIVHFEEALRLKPDASEAFHIHHNLGRALAESGQLDQAIAHYREALRLKPDYPEAHNNYGLALARQEEFERAIEQYRLALEDRPGFAPALNNLATAHHDLGLRFFAAGRTTDAIREFSAALELSPTLASAFDHRGFARAATGEMAAAIADFRAAIAQDPKLARAHFHLGLALGAVGQLADAERELALAVELDPTHARARAMLDQVRARLKRGGGG
jgi:tetratricopeptide (TPR) repeat protein